MRAKRVKVEAPVYRLDPKQVAREAACVLPDERLEKRLEQVVSTMCKQPAASLPQLFPDDAGLEAVYRFLDNKRTSLGVVLAGHVAHTVARAKALRTVAVAHDTTEFSFPKSKGKCNGKRKGKRNGKRTGLQHLSEQRQGFFLHASLAISADGAKAPLGCLSAQPFVRLTELERAEHAAWERTMGRDFSEPGRWLRGIRRSEHLLGPDVSAIHLCDREGDSFSLLSKLVQQGSRFVIRLCQNRTLSGIRTDCSAQLMPFLSEQPLRGEPRQVLLSARTAGKGSTEKQTHAPRGAREATLGLSSVAVTVKKPKNRSAKQMGSQTLDLHIVEVIEQQPPPNEEPVRWTLCTTEPIETEADCWRVVDLYRSRWLIEEYFKAVKTGCGYERRQLDSAKTLLVMLGVTLTVAWTLLLLRYLEREAPDAAAEAVLPSDLVQFLKRVWPKGVAPEAPTVRQALLAIAALGGHRKHNGPPGWLVLHRGYHRLLTLHEGAQIGLPDGGCDQS